MQLQTELRWQKYVRCLRQGAWVDHITLQAVSNMLSVKIIVLSSNHLMFYVTSGVCSAEREIFVGFTLQHHYLGLDKLPVCGASVQHNVQSNPNETSGTSENTPVADEVLDDATVEEGDEHRMQISGTHMASMMSVENPESPRDIVCCSKLREDRL